MKPILDETGTLYNYAIILIKIQHILCDILIN